MGVPADPQACRLPSGWPLPGHHEAWWELGGADRGPTTWTCSPAHCHLLLGTGTLQPEESVPRDRQVCIGEDMNRVTAVLGAAEGGGGDPAWVGRTGT